MAHSRRAESSQEKESHVDQSVKVEASLLHENVCQALADPKRIIILYLLADGPRNVTEIAEELESPQSTVSRHLKILRERSIVTTERDGSQIVYSLADRRIIQALDLMRAMVMSSLRESGRLAEAMSATSELSSAATVGAAATSTPAASAR
jgi:ArsR family transcriptional regulator